MGAAAFIFLALVCTYCVCSCMYRASRSESRAVIGQGGEPFVQNVPLSVSQFYSNKNSSSKQRGAGNISKEYASAATTTQTSMMMLDPESHDKTQPG